MLGGDELIDFWTQEDCIDIYAPACDDDDDEEEEGEFLDAQESGFMILDWRSALSGALETTSFNAHQDRMR